MLKLNKKSLSKLNGKNPMWKGDNVGYKQLHEWVRRRLPKPDICKCGERKPIDLANKGVYDRNLKNWEWLCRRCHMEKDGRLKRFLGSRTGFKKGNTSYKLRVDLKGEKHPLSKLNKEKVLEIRSKYETGNYTLSILATEYNVCFQSISLIVNRKNWKHV